jgi:uncharacterized protein involved in exopolysaccharide biosynthesis
MDQRENQRLPERRGSHGAGSGMPGEIAAAEVIAAPQSRQGSPVVPRNQMRRQSDRGFNLGTVLGLMLRRRKTVLAVFSLLFLPVLGYVATREAKYETELRLLLKRQAAPGVASATGAAGVSEADVQAEIELLKSKELYEAAGREAKLIGERAKPREVALEVAGIEQRLKIAQVGKTNIISVKYHAGEPGAAAAIPNALAELYLQKHIALHSNDEAARFFSDQTGIYQRQLEAAQTALTRFRQTGDVTLLQEQKQAYLRRATDLEAAAQETESSLRDLEQRALMLERQRDGLPATVETGNRVARGSATVEKLKSLLIDLGNKRTELLTKYDANYRLVKEVDKQIADARTALERESAPQVVDQTNAPNPLRQGLESDLLRTQSQMAGLRARRQTVDRDLTEYRVRQHRLEQATANHNDLERAVKIAEENFLLYQRKLEEARLAEALDKQRLLTVAILEKASVPALAASQHRTFLLLFGFLAAAFLALASAFVADYLERNLPTRESLAQAAPVAAGQAAEAAAPVTMAAAAPVEAIAAATPAIEISAEPVLQPSLPAARVMAALGPRPVVVERKRPAGETAARPQPVMIPAAKPAMAAAPSVASVLEKSRLELERNKAEERPVTAMPAVPGVTGVPGVPGVTAETPVTAVAVRSVDAWRELFDRRSRGAALVRQQQVTATKTAGSTGGSKIDPEFLRRVQDKKTPSRDNRTGTRG